MEKQIEFLIDGKRVGSSTLFISNGELDASSAEEAFWKAVRYDRNALIEEEREDIIDNLTNEQEEKLNAAFADSGYHGTDDDMPDAYEDWLMQLPLDKLKAILNLS